MRKTQKHLPRFIPFIAAVAVLTMSACGPAKPSPTPTMSVDAIYTAAYHTLVAQQATQLALTPPTPLPTQTLLPTLRPTAATIPPFGTAATSAGGVVTGCDSSVYVSDVTIPDGTVIAPGKSFVKTWTVMNNGTCAWTTVYKLAFATGEPMGGTSVPVPSSVPVGQQVQISVSLTAPTADGDYTGWWRLQNAAGQFFGNSISVVIKVGSGSSATNTTGAPATTNTPAALPTLTPTP